MAVDRRSFLKGVAAAGAAGVASASPVKAARERKVAPADARGMLYDTTLCIGCKACVRACKEANELPADTRVESMGGLYDAPLSSLLFSSSFWPFLCVLWSL